VVVDQPLLVSTVDLVVVVEAFQMVDHTQEVLEIDKQEHQHQHRRKVILVEQVNTLLEIGKEAAEVVVPVVLEEMEHQVLAQLVMVE